MTRNRVLMIGLIFGLVAIVVTLGFATRANRGWPEEEKAILSQLWIGSLPALPDDPSNLVANDPLAAEFGHRLFFDARLSSNGQLACATCHQPERAFSDGLPLAQGVGTTERKTPTIIGAAYSPWQFWDGRTDSQWAQALGPLESPVEHGGTRTMYALIIAEHFAEQYEALFGPLPDLTDSNRFPRNAGPHGDDQSRTAWYSMTPEDREIVNEIFVNMGKSIAAYERQIIPGESRFDRYVEAILADDFDSAERILTSEEIAGLRLFISKGNCVECHNGPLLTNSDFHNIGVPPTDGHAPDPGRAVGAVSVLESEFNCLSQYSDAGERDCDELKFLRSDAHELEGAFKTPTLRLIGDRAPYMHAGQMTTLDEVVRHHNDAPAASFGHSELVPLGLSEVEINQLVAFLRALDSPIDAPSELLDPPTK